MRCILCSKNTNKIIKTIGKTDIYECSNCKLGFLKQKIKTKTDLNIIYNFDEYKSVEKKQIDRFDRLSEKIVKYKKTGRVLDIGSGFGLFSNILGDKGKYSFDLIEPLVMPYYMKGRVFKLHKKTLDSFLKTNKKKFDIIIMMDILEHLKDPVTSLLKIHKILEKDGILVIQTPNYKSLMARICKNWSWWMIEDHKWFFSTKSLNLLLAKTGFVKKNIMTYEDIYDFKKNLDGNFMDINNVYIRKAVKYICLPIFFIPYFISRNLLWKYKMGGLIYSVFEISR